MARCRTTGAAGARDSPRGAVRAVDALKVVREERPSLGRDDGAAVPGQHGADPISSLLLTTTNAQQLVNDARCCREC